jgi:hypothetical protein
MIPQEHKHEIITSGMQFMRSITEAYGADEGMRLWETIANTLDPDIKGQIFFAMITGTHNDTIVLKPGLAGSGVTANRVAAIKEIRTWTGMSLRDAKDTSDMVEAGRTVKITVKPGDHANALRGLRKVGFYV